MLVKQFHRGEENLLSCGRQEEPVDDTKKPTGPPGLEGAFAAAHTLNIYFFLQFL